ncbi:MAG TPA: hypothetical protein VII01_12080 [Solirubrobacteraceae bacterium]
MTHRRESWKLPRFKVAGDSEGRPGTYGYSTHTARTVFRTATTRIVTPDVESSAIYTAPIG